MKIASPMVATLAPAKELMGKDKNPSTGFENVLKEELNKINSMQIRADNENQKLIIGESEDIHTALLAAEEARLALEMAVQVRNKLIESYQEINRIQL